VAGRSHELRWSARAGLPYNRLVERPDTLLESPLLANLDHDHREAMLAAAIRRRLERDAILFHEGDRAEGLFVLASGRIKLVRYTPQGKEMLVHLVRSGQSFADAALFGPGTYPATAVAVEPSEVWLWPRSRLLKQMRSSPELALALIVSLSVWTRHLVGTLELLTQRRVEERLAVYLQGRGGGRSLGSGDEIVLGEAKQLVAAQIGTAPEVLSRTFRRLEEAGVLAVRGDAVQILDQELFNALAEPIERSDGS
jgi:CRP/FNR family transcriptional regulator